MKGQHLLIPDLPLIIHATKYLDYRGGHGIHNGWINWEVGIFYSSRILISSHLDNYARTNIQIPLTTYPRKYAFSFP